MATSADVRAAVCDLADKPEDPRPPTGHGMRGVEISLTEQHGLDVYRLRPRARKRSENGPIGVYLHGGAYIGEMHPRAWRLMASVVRRSGSTLLVPIYRLAPAVTAEATVDVCADIVSDAIATSGTRGVVVFGDSAGGGLTLSTAIELRRRGGPQPKRLVMISPWLDVTMTHEEQLAIEPYDVMLTVEGLAECGRLYAGDLGVTDWRVSPLFADLHDLPSMSVACGTHDILVVDSRRFAQKATETGADITYEEMPAMLHSVLFTPLLPESAKAREVLINALRGCH